MSWPRRRGFAPSRVASGSAQLQFMTNTDQNAPPQQQGMTIDQAMAQAHARWEAGQAQHAEMLCRQVLQAWPGHPDALHLLGLMAHAFGSLGAAIDYLRQACRATRPPPVY